MKNKLNSFITLSIFIMLFLAIPMNIHSQDNSLSIFQCAPCGCGSDGKQFNEPGNCPSCGMKLKKVQVPHRGLKKLEKPLNVAILIYPHAQVLDYAAPYDIFVSGGKNFNVYTVAKTRNSVITMPNLSVNPQYNLENAPKADIIIIPGGMWNIISNETKEWIKESSKNADYVLSVCTGAFILAELNLLDNLNATTHSAGLDLLEKKYPAINKIEREVRYVDNGKIITSAGVSAGMDASFHVISKVLGDDWVKAIKKNLEFKD